MLSANFGLKQSKDLSSFLNIKICFHAFSVDFVHLDLASLKSVRTFAEKFLSRNLPLNILINNGK